MSRFLPADPFYRSLAEAESRERIERLVALDRERYARQMAARPLPVMRTMDDEPLPILLVVSGSQLASAVRDPTQDRRAPRADRI